MNREIALACAARGWPVHPVHISYRTGGKTDKKPLTKWNVEASTNKAKIDAWWEEFTDPYVGVITGQKSGLYVVDVDDPDALAASGLDVSAGIRVPTNRPGGAHYYYAGPEDGKPIRNSAADGLDFRGDGGWVMCWNGPPTEPLVPIPPAVAEFFRHRGRREANAVEDGEPIPEGRREALLTSMAGAMRRRGATAEEILYALVAMNRRCAPPLGQDDLERIARSVGRYPPGEDTSPLTAAVACRTGQQRTEPAGPVPEEGEDASSLKTPPRLSDEFWGARPALQHIRQAARARMISPDALLGAVLANACVLADYHFVLPPIVGSWGSLNISVVIVGPPGMGKGSAIRSAKGLVGKHLLGDYSYVDDLVAGTGEGLVHAFFRSDGARPPTLVQVHQGALVNIDEGETLGKLAERSGATIVPVLRSAYSGEALGGQYAARDKRAKLPLLGYRLGVVMALQPEKAQFIFDDSQGGLPQRVMWFSAYDPDCPERTPPYCGPLPWEVPRWAPADETDPSCPVQGAQVIRVDEAIVEELRSARKKVLRGEVDELETHLGYTTLKVAAILAFLDGRVNVTSEDWGLAKLVVSTSTQVSQWVQTRLKAQARQQADEVAKRRHLAVVEGEQQAQAKKVAHAAQLLARYARELGEAQAKSTLRRKLPLELRKCAKEALGYAVDQGWLEEVDEHHVRAAEQEEGAA